VLAGAVVRWHPEKTSLSRFHAFAVTGVGPGCALRIEILEGSSSPDDEHKVGTLDHALDTVSIQLGCMTHVSTPDTLTCPSIRHRHWQS
jgi:hypothetical protein